jgi:hypothetical protein
VSAVVPVLGAAAVMANGIIYGTEVFAATVQRPALTHVDDGALTRVMGYIHHFAGRRMAPPGIVGLLAAIAATALAVVDGLPAASVAGAVSVSALLAWLTVFNRVTVPLDKAFAAAALGGTDLPEARTMQQKWDSVIGTQAALQAVALVGMCVLIVTGGG